LKARAENMVMTTGVEQQAAGPDAVASELRRSLAAPLLIIGYKVLRGPGTAFLRRLIARLLLALESGQMRSSSLRQVMAEVHGVEIGAHSYGCFDPVRFPPGIRVGRYVSVGPSVAAYRRNHPMDRLSLHPYFYRPELGAGKNADVETASLEIGAGSWLGANAIILPGCRRIGRGAVVAAGAVLTRDVPDYAVVGGNPARFIRYRFGAEGIADADATRWWLQDPERLSGMPRISEPWDEGDVAKSRDCSDV
jgi:acetyltransferase-like isoleucine patch superfamily enzyme